MSLASYRAAPPRVSRSDWVDTFRPVPNGEAIIHPGSLAGRDSASRFPVCRRLVLHQPRFGCHAYGLTWACLGTPRGSRPPRADAKPFCQTRMAPRPDFGRCPAIIVHMYIICCEVRVWTSSDESLLLGKLLGVFRFPFFTPQNTPRNSKRCTKNGRFVSKAGARRVARTRPA